MKVEIITPKSYEFEILDVARSILKDGFVKTGEVLKGYADVMGEVFNEYDVTGKTVIKAWYDIKSKKTKALINDERKKFKEVILSLGFENATADAYWLKVKEYSGKAKTPKVKTTVQGTPDPVALTLANTKTIINRILNDEDADSVLQEVKQYFMTAYEVLGGSLGDFAELDDGESDEI
jgi:hypothetical protein